MSGRLRAAACAFACALALCGCEREEGPRLLYGYFTREGAGKAAVLVFDRTPAASVASALRFTPAPEGTFTCAPGERPGEVKVSFGAPAPFAEGQGVAVTYKSAGGGDACVLRDGRPHPVLVGAVWHDTNDDRIVDAGDALQLRFDGEVMLPRGGGEILESEVELLGRDRLGGGRSVKAQVVPGGVRLWLGEGAFLRPGGADAADCSELTLNGTHAAPSRAILGKGSGLGAVSHGSVRVRLDDGFAPFKPRGVLPFGPSGGNLEATVTFVGRGGRTLAVIAGGLSHAPELRPAADVFVVNVDSPSPPWWVGTLRAPRARHAAVALPAPAGSTALGAVLYLGGVTEGGVPALRPEILVIREGGGTATYVTPEAEGFPADAFSPPRVDAGAAYVPDSPASGLVVIAGGDQTGFIGVLRVVWREGAGTPDVTRLARNWVLPRAANRTGHTLTPIEMSDGEKAVFLFGGRFFGVAGVSSAAMPALLFPGRAASESPLPWASVDFGSIDEYNLKREGHAAVYLPGARKVVIIGGERQAAGVRGLKMPQIDSVIEYEPATGQFLELYEALSCARIEPALALFPDGERVLVVGGRDPSGEPLPTCEVYTRYVPPRSARSLSFGGALPSEALGASVGASPENGGAAVYLVGGKGRGVWELRL